MFSGTPLDWSVGYAADATALFLLGSSDPLNLLGVTHTAVVSATVPEAAGQLATLKFGTLSPTPIMPASCTITTSGSGSIDQYPQTMLFSGGIVQGSAQQVSITLGYSAKALTTCTPIILKDPVTNSYPSSVDYVMYVDGVSKASGTLVPSDSSNSISLSIAATVATSVQLVFTCRGGCIISNCLPQSAAQTKTVGNSVNSLVLDVVGGNLIQLASHSIIDNLVPSAITITPRWS